MKILRLRELLWQFKVAKGKSSSQQNVINSELIEIQIPFKFQVLTEQTLS